MKKSNVILALVLIAFVVCVVIVLAFRLNADKKEANVNIDLTALNERINTETNFSEMTMQDLDKESLSSLFGIETDKVEEVIGKIPLINVHANMYVVVKATEGNAEYVREKLEEYGTLYEQNWEKYLPEQYELVKQRKIGVQGNYVYFVVSDMANEIVKMME